MDKEVKHIYLWLICNDPDYQISQDENGYITFLWKSRFVEVCKLNIADD